MKKLFTFIVLGIFSASLLTMTGTIKGTVLDQQSEIPIIGASVQLTSTDPAIGTITDIDGYFILENVLIGRNVLEISYLVYETVTLPNVEVISCKDVLPDVTIREAFYQLNEVVITAKTNMDQPLNEKAAISARQFSVEEVNRFFGGRSDVGRLASNFAGMSAPGFDLKLLQDCR